MNSLPGLTMVVPAYNEVGSIAETVQRIQKTLAALHIASELIVVNDGSTDGTGELLEEIPGIHVVHHPLNIGYGNSIKSGVNRAHYQWIGIVDADGSYPIEDLPRFVAEMEKGFDMVVGHRANIDDIDCFAKRIFRRIYKKIVSFLNDSRIEDPNSGFRLFKREIVINLMPFLCGTFSFTTSISILTSGLFYFVKFIPIQYSKRDGKTKVKHLRDSIRTMQFIVQGIVFFNPIKFFIILALAMVAFVCIPAMLIAMLRMPTLSLYYMIFGVAVSLMVGMGALGDIIRISSFKRTNEFM
ncbi:glycosyltransferase family 2 protein [Geomonas paludis]|uniref:Glycosyl transferase n=1 Tax=Geomonas paludis TaxID=2740185 RepID=A0A6V8MYL4_9BACT|nr:glycosyltransferase family 2 protein [Geomonas paludis]UPU36488.1 glycosyltransferase family 2 protein [Geomonas paludis]GFO65335.1 glycosyl transferase [Geomonas paludis]